MAEADVEFEPLNLEKQIGALNREQVAHSQTSFGERMAASINCLTPDELRARIATAEFIEGADKLVEVLVWAEHSLQTRLDLVQAAIARLAIVGEVVPLPAHGEQVDGRGPS
jgi:hypothetical protein